MQTFSYCFTQDLTHTGSLAAETCMCLFLLTFIPRLYPHACPCLDVQHFAKPSLLERLYKYIWHNLTCWFAETSSELYFLSPPAPPVSAHHPPVKGRWLTAGLWPCLPCSSGVTPSQTTMAMSRQLSGPTCYSPEVRGSPQRSGMSLWCSGQGGNTETLFPWLYVTFIAFASCLTPAVSALKPYISTQAFFFSMGRHELGVYTVCHLSRWKYEVLLDNKYQQPLGV